MLWGAVTMLHGLDGAIEGAFDGAFDGAFVGAFGRAFAGAFDGALGQAPVCVEDGMKVEVWSEE